MDGDAFRQFASRTVRLLGVILDMTRTIAFSFVASTFVFAFASKCTADDPSVSSQSATTMVLGDQSATTGEAKYNDVDAALERRGSITFRKTSLSEVVFMLSEHWKVNIVAGEGVSGEVSGTFYNAPLKEVLAAILSANNYGYRRTGHSLIVLPADRIGSDDPGFVSQTWRIGDSVSEETLEAARLLLSPGGQMRSVGSEMVFVIDHPERIESVRKFLASLSPDAAATNATPSRPAQPAQSAQPVDAVSRQNGPELVPPPAPDQPIGGEFSSGIAYFTPQFSDAEPMVEALRQAMGDTVNIAVYGAENRIMILGTPEQLRLATDAISHLDVPRPQVRIRALIYDVALEELERLGVDWSSSIGSRTLASDGFGRNAINGTTGLAVAPAATTIVGGSAIPLASAAEGSTFVIRSLNENFRVSAFITALDSTAGAKLLADPTITVTDRSEASIRIVQKIPITNTSQLGGTTTAITSVTFEEAGITLNVTPRISRDATIQMQVRPEFSVLVGYQNGQPLIDSRTAETTVRVADRQTFVLGGLRQTATTEVVKGVPFLKDLKHVGKLFRSHSTTIRESELIVFLQPEIIDEFYAGTPREQRAACIANQELDRIPVADEALFIPDCQDKHCPYHHPRPRVNSGTSSLEMIGETGVACNGSCIHQPVTTESRGSTYEITVEDCVQPEGTDSEAATEELPPVKVDTRSRSTD
jgi:general secretion pathway protein D